MLDFLKKMFAPEKSSSDTARDRLRLVLLSDHLALAPEVVDALRADILAVISKYVEIDSAHADLTFEHRENEVAMLASIPIIAVRDRGLAVAASGSGSLSAVATAAAAPPVPQARFQPARPAERPQPAGNAPGSAPASAPSMSLTAAEVPPGPQAERVPAAPGGPPRPAQTPEPFGAGYEDGGFEDEADLAPAEPLCMIDGPGPVAAAPIAPQYGVPTVAAARPAVDERDGSGRPRAESDVAVAATLANVANGEVRVVAADRFGLDAGSLGLHSDGEDESAALDDADDGDDGASDAGIPPEAAGGVPGALPAAGSTGAASPRRRKRRRKP